MYIVEGPKYTHKRHQNQLQKRLLNDSNDVPQTEEEPIDTIFDMFDLDPPQPTPQIRRSGRKRKFTDPLMIYPKRKKILTILLRSKRLGGGVLWEPYPSYRNGLFSPLLELEISLPRGRLISVLSKQYKTSYLFYVTLSFLCNIICELISVFAFSLVTLSGATTVYEVRSKNIKMESLTILILEFKMKEVLLLC